MTSNSLCRESLKAEYEEDNEFVDRALAVAELIVEVCFISHQH